MGRYFSMCLLTLAGAVFGAAAVTSLNAQGKAPGAYVIVDITSINNPDAFKAIMPKIGPANAAVGSKPIVQHRKHHRIGRNSAQALRHRVVRQRGKSQGLERFTGHQRGQRHSQARVDLALVHRRGAAELRRVRPDQLPHVAMPALLAGIRPFLAASTSFPSPACGGGLGRGHTPRHEVADRPPPDPPPQAGEGKEVEAYRRRLTDIGIGL